MYSSPQMSPIRTLLIFLYFQIAKFPYSSLESQSSLSKEAQESSIWLRLTRDTLTKLITCLETTIRCWDNRSAKEQPSTNYEDRCLGAILSTISDLRDRLFELQNVLRRCGEHERAVSTFVNPITEIKAKSFCLVEP